MNEFNVGDKVYLECKVSDEDKDNTYELKYRNWHGDEELTNFVTVGVLHTPDESYNKGLNDAWELARKIILPSRMDGYTADEFKNIFGKDTYISAMRDFTPQEALAKAKEYEERNEIKVGDVVAVKGGFIEGIVTRVEGRIYRLFRDGSCNSNIGKEDLVKTGKHFDSIDEFMKQED